MPEKRVTARSSLPRYIDDTPTSIVMENTEGFTYDPSATPPSFGHAMRKYWGFEEKYVNVNHGVCSAF